LCYVEIWPIAVAVRSKASVCGPSLPRGAIASRGRGIFCYFLAYHTKRSYQADFRYERWKSGGKWPTKLAR